MAKKHRKPHVLLCQSIHFLNLNTNLGISHSWWMFKKTLQFYHFLFHISLKIVNTHLNSLIFILSFKALKSIIFIHFTNWWLLIWEKQKLFLIRNNVLSLYLRAIEFSCIVPKCLKGKENWHEKNAYFLLRFVMLEWATM